MMLTTVSILATITFIFLIAFALVSLFEKEYKAMRRAFVLSIIIPVVFLTPHIITSPYNEWLALILILLTAALLLILLTPINAYRKVKIHQAKGRIDERTTMFSRREINKKTPHLKQVYYELYPEHKELDEEWMNKPGLMAEHSQFYTPFTFNAADSSFDAIEHMHPLVDGPINENKTEANPDKLSVFVKNWSKKLGAVDAGICLSQDYHYYSIKGRGDSYGSSIDTFHKYAIAITVEMDAEFLAAGPAGPTLMESAQQYFNSGGIAIQIAQYLRSLGYSSRAHIDGNYQVVCPLVARDAGLGEIGRMGLLMTPKLGPRVRIAVITTDAPLVEDNRKTDKSVQQFCELCKKCAHVCPSQAISKHNKTIINGVERWQINQEKCFSYWCTSGTDCGRCMSVCPYSHPNNWMHNIIRWGIRHSYAFRVFALKLDDFFYGKKPKPKKIPAWLNV